MIQAKVIQTFVLAIPVCTLFSSSAIASCLFFSEPQRYNTQELDGVMLIGKLRDRPYQVVVSGADETATQRLQACVIDAFITRSNFGTYIQAGSFKQRSDAEALRRILQSEGYRARVTYQR